MRDKVLILGAAGFIGTNLTLRLLEKNQNLVLFDREEAEYKGVIADSAKVNRVSGQFTDMSTEKWLSLIPELERVSVVYHLVSTTCPTNSNQDIAGEIQDNLIGTIRFLDACVKTGVERVVFLSSGGTVYGKEHKGLCREEEEAFPITAYGLQKLSIEKILYLYLQMYGLDYRIVRLSNPYGPYQKADGIQGVVTTFTHRMLYDQPITVYGDGSVIRDYIYIDDAIEGILTIAENAGKQRLYNLGSGQGHSILQVIETVADVLQKQPKVMYCEGRRVDVPVNVLDISRYKRDFGAFSPISLRTGIERLVTFFMS